MNGGHTTHGLGHSRPWDDLMEIISPTKTALTTGSALSFLDYPRFDLFAECHSLLNKLLGKIKEKERIKIVRTGWKEDRKEHSNKC